MTRGAEEMPTFMPLRARGASLLGLQSNLLANTLKGASVRCQSKSLPNNKPTGRGADFDAHPSRIGRHMAAAGRAVQGATGSLLGQLVRLLSCRAL